MRPSYLLLWMTLLIGVSALAACSSDTVADDQPLVDREIRVEGRMFAWNVTQAGPDGKLDTSDDIKLVNNIVIPVGSRIKFKLSSKDVLHGFFVPRLGIRTTVIPGRAIEKEAVAVKEGRFPMACSQVCGPGHGQMLGWIHVVPQAQYESWLTGRKSEKNGLEPNS